MSDNSQLSIIYSKINISIINPACLYENNSNNVKNINKIRIRIVFCNIARYTEYRWMELKGDVMEMKYVVRLLGIEINNIKNVIHGEIEMPQNKKGSILGIYGANGSGKTVVMDCMVLLKYLLSGRQIPSNFYYYINEASDTSTVKYRFELKIEEKCYLVEYV